MFVFASAGRTTLFFFFSQTPPLLLLFNSKFCVYVLYTPLQIYCCFNIVLVSFYARAISHSLARILYSNNKHTNNKKTRIYLLAFATLSNSSFFLIA